MVTARPFRLWLHRKELIDSFMITLMLLFAKNNATKMQFAPRLMFMDLIFSITICNGAPSEPAHGLESQPSIVLGDDVGFGEQRP